MKKQLRRQVILGRRESAAQIKHTHIRTDPPARLMKWKSFRRAPMFPARLFCSWNLKLILLSYSSESAAKSFLFNFLAAPRETFGRTQLFLIKMIVSGPRKDLPVTFCIYFDIRLTHFHFMTSNFTRRHHQAVMKNWKHYIFLGRKFQNFGGQHWKKRLRKA